MIHSSGLLAVTKDSITNKYTIHADRIPILTAKPDGIVGLAKAVLKEELPMCDINTRNDEFEYVVMISHYPDSCLDCPFANLDDERLDMGDIFCRITEEIHPNNELHPMRQRPDDCPLETFCEE